MLVVKRMTFLISKPLYTHACNCREKPKSPLDGACLTKSIVYMAQVTAQNREQKQYIGMTENDFKGRYNVHKQSTQSMKIPRLCLNTFGS